MKNSEKTMLVIIVVSAIVVLSGTVFGLSTGTRARKLTREAIAAKIQAAGQEPTAGQAIFEGIGRIRARSADAKPAIIVAQIVFPYDQGDRALREELFSKKELLRKAAIDFFAGKSAAELSPASENALKAGLRDSLNYQLVLGKIGEVYLPQFNVIP